MAYRPVGMLSVCTGLADERWLVATLDRYAIPAGERLGGGEAPIEVPQGQGRRSRTGTSASTTVRYLNKTRQVSEARENMVLRDTLAEEGVSRDTT